MNAIVIEINCKYCKQKFDISVDENKYFSWRTGEGLIQDVMPELTAEERELLISRTCDACFDRIFVEANNGEE